MVQSTPWLHIRISFHSDYHRTTTALRRYIRILFSTSLSLAAIVSSTFSRQPSEIISELECHRAILLLSFNTMPNSKQSTMARSILSNSSTKAHSIADTIKHKLHVDGSRIQQMPLIPKPIGYSDEELIEYRQVFDMFDTGK